MEYGKISVDEFLQLALNITGTEPDTVWESKHLSIPWALS